MLCFQVLRLVLFCVHPPPKRRRPSHQLQGTPQRPFPNPLRCLQAWDTMNTSISAPPPPVLTIMLQAYDVLAKTLRCHHHGGL